MVFSHRAFKSEEAFRGPGSILRSGLYGFDQRIDTYLSRAPPSGGGVYHLYVDNFEVQSAEVASTTEALHTLQNVCSLLDVQLDAKKTVRWSCAAEGSREIRQTRAAIVTHAQDLGAHMQFDARRSSRTVLDKFKQLPDLWHLLACSQASYEQKFKILRTVAWPRAMYAISTVHAGPAHFTDARAGAMQVLGATKAGANPQLHLALTTSAITDPESYAFWNSVMQFRRHIPPDLVDLTLAQAAATTSSKSKPGPGGVLLTRFEQICWTYVADGVFHDGEGSFAHILRLARAWQHMVGRKWEHRQGYAALRYVSAPLSQPAPFFSSDETGFIRVAQNGTFYTNDMLLHSGLVPNELCKFCGGQDSVRHRQLFDGLSEPHRSA